MKLSSKACAFLASCAFFLITFSTIQAQKPVIRKIDPPGWWAGMPDPMLLLQGENLQDAQFAVNGSGVKLSRTQTSSNGHWAFLWLDIKGAGAQTLWVTAANKDGRVRQAYTLAQRSHPAQSHLGFSPADVIYLIMTDRFADGNPANNPPGYNRAKPRGWHGGDLAGIQQHVDYLHALGVTALWTTPVASNTAMSDSYHGYAATDLYAVDPHFGSLADYQHLSAALHAKGIKLVIDLVPNHIGVQHPWVLDPPAPGWLHGTLQHHIITQSNFADLVDPHAPRQAWNAVTTGWFTDAMPDLNQENPLVSQYLIQNAIWWVETANVDGIRLDTFPYVGRPFWHDFHAQLHALYPHLTTVGEIFNGDAELTSYFAGGRVHDGVDTGLDTPFDFPVYFTLRNVLNHDKPFTDLARVLRQDALYPHPDHLVPFIGNHDTSRFLTDAGGSLPRLKLALGLLLTLRGTPQLYSGDEIGMTGGSDPDNRHDFPGGFAGDPQSAFTPSTRTAQQQEVFAWTSALLKFRSSHPALQAGLQQDLLATADTFAFVRTPSASGCSDRSAVRTLVVVNKAQQTKSIDLDLNGTALSGCSAFTIAAPTQGTAPNLNAQKLHIEEPAESITLIEAH